MAQKKIQSFPIIIFPILFLVSFLIISCTPFDNLDVVGKGAQEGLVKDPEGADEKSISIEQEVQEGTEVVIEETFPVKIWMEGVIPKDIRDEIKTYIDKLGIPRPKRPAENTYGFWGWYPRIWDGWAREHDDAECCTIEAGEKQ